MNISRRDFLRTSAIGTFTLLPAHVVLGKKSKSGMLSPSERVNLAVVGIGNQGNGDRRAMLHSGLCNVVALCDVHLEGGHTVEARFQHRLLDTLPASYLEEKDNEIPQRHSKARTFTDFRKMFDEMGDEIDAVLIATPDHSHFSIAIHAMSIGKHVYVEKPLAHTFGQSERLIDLAQRSGVVTQMGNQGHSGGNYFQFKAWTEAGVIKDVTRITAHMNNWRRWHGWGASVKEYPNEPIPDGLKWDLWANVAPVKPFSAKLHPQEWRSWYDYGSGAFGDWGPHILDTCHRFLKLGLPTSVKAVKREGVNPLVFPQASTINFHFPKRNGMPACDVTWYDGQKNLPVIEPEYGDLVTDEETGETSRAPVNLGGPGKVIYSKDLVFKGGSHGRTLSIIPKEKFMDMRRSLPRFSQKNSNHYANFLLACKGEEESRSPFSVSGELTQVFNLGVIAQRLGGNLEFDPKVKRFTNSEEANELLDPAPRKGWKEYYRM